MDKITQLIDEANADMKHHQAKVEKYKKRVEILSSAGMITPEELHKVLITVDSNNTKGNGIEYGLGKDSYTHILGGDGRSQPWDERREGMVCSVKIDYIIDYDLAPRIVKYMKYMLECEYVYIVDVLGDRYDRQ